MQFTKGDGMPRSVSPAKNQSMTDYRRATGFEALMGYLYLKKEYERMVELVKIGLESLEEECSKNEKKQENRIEENKRNNKIEGRNAVLEAFRSGKPIDKLFVLDGCQDGPVQNDRQRSKKSMIRSLNFVAKERLNQLSETGRHQGVIAQAAAYEYAQVEDMLELAERKGEDPFLDPSG